MSGGRASFYVCDDGGMNVIIDGTENEGCCQIRSSTLHHHRLHADPIQQQEKCNR